MTTDPRSSPAEPEVLEIHFRGGLPVRVVNKGRGQDIADPLELFVHLNQVGGLHGIGRIDIVENRFIGEEEGEEEVEEEEEGELCLWARIEKNTDISINRV